MKRFPISLGGRVSEAKGRKFGNDTIAFALQPSYAGFANNKNEIITGECMKEVEEKLKGKWVLITGASSGFGIDFSTIFTESGANLVNASKIFSSNNYAVAHIL